MSDIALDLLSFIETTLITETASGGVLDDIMSFFVLRTATDAPPEYGSQTPVLVVSMLQVTGETISIPGTMVQKVYPVRFSLFTENGGDTTDDEAAAILDLIEDVFFQQTYGLSEWWDFVSKNYNQTTLQGFSGDWNGAGEYICNHIHTDVRSCPS